MKTLLKLLLCLFVAGLPACSSGTDEIFSNEPAELKNGSVPENTPARGLDQHRYVIMQVMNNNDQSIDLKVHYRIIGKVPVDMVFISGWTNPLTVYTKQSGYFRDLESPWKKFF